MRVSILLGLLLLLVPLQCTLLTYIVEKEVDQADTFVEITAKIQVDGPSLQQSIHTSEQLIEDIRKIVTEDCLNSDKKGKSKKCKDTIEESKYEVQAKYHLVRKIKTFTLFILINEVTIRIYNLPRLGKIIDAVVEQGNDLITLQQLAWKTEDEVDPQTVTLKDGLAEGKELCKKMGKILQEVVSVEELEDIEKEEGQEEDGKDPDLTEAEVEKVIFKFKVLCEEKVKKAKKEKPAAK